MYLTGALTERRLLSVCEARSILCTDHTILITQKLTETTNSNFQRPYLLIVPSKRYELALVVIL